MGTVLGGSAGAVNDVDTVGNWSVTSTADLQAVIASNTKKGTVLLDGNTDWSGSWVAYKGTPDYKPGDTLTFTGSIDGTNGATGSVMVDSIEIVIDIEAGGVITATVNFSGNGALTLGAAAATDATTPDPPTSIGTKVELGTMVAVPVWTEVDDVRTVTLTLTRDNQAYVSSSTSGATKRIAGNWSATVAMTVYEDDWADIETINAEKRMRIYVDSTTYWLVEFVKLAEASDLTVDIEAGALIGATQNFQWTAYADVAGSQTEGEITDPGSTTWWP